MENSFESLIEKFGPARIIVPNTPRVLSLNDGHLLVGSDPETPRPEAKLFHRRYKFGDSDYLAFASRTETDLEREKELVEYLKSQNQQPIEFVYRYYRFYSYDASPDRLVSKVAIGTDADAQPVSRAELLEAVAEERLLGVAGWSSMGDAYLHVSICGANYLPNDEGVNFLFEYPLDPQMLVHIGDNYDRGDDEMDFCARELFYRRF